MIRKGGLFLVMLGALALSFAGQMAAVRPLLGEQLAVVFALTTDLATLLALNEVTATSRGAVRVWAWSVLLLAGGTALGLNTWHALETGLLPAPAAVAVGAGPVVLAWLLSHLMALVLAERREAAENAAQQSPEPAPAVSREPVVQAADSGSAEPRPEAADGTTQAVSGPAQGIDRRESIEEPGSTLDPVREALTATAGTESETASPALPIELIDRAERLDRQRRRETGGKRGLPYREAPRRLGVRYDTARAALIAARARRAADTHEFAA
ncbi:hypothetical protein [Saccharopolyspora gloriosae]|uniref:hypothetical protein n=1 Tax=Saccharopolyspora gloriosae TaxID=455344 RepID=UPI001FB6CAE1|nr:hypothetical protein [Saccharopolyspora gloriosae]